MHIPSAFRKVLIYTGEGLYAESLQKHAFIFEYLKKHSHKPWTLEYVSSSELITRLKREPKLEETLLDIPAGESTKLEKDFSDEQIRVIQKAIGNGMRLFSTCGSSYMLSRERIWNDKCDEQPTRISQIKKSGRFNIFDGIAQGPLSPYPGQTYNSAFFHEAVKVRNSTSTICTLLSGGGAFFPFPSTAQNKVLATYLPSELERLGKDPCWEAAIVKCSYGKGSAIMSMIHPGYGKEDIHIESYKKAFPDRKDDWEMIYRSLSSEQQRMDFVETILREFEIP